MSAHAQGKKNGKNEKNTRKFKRHAESGLMGSFPIISGPVKLFTTCHLWSQKDDRRVYTPGLRLPHQLPAGAPAPGILDLPEPPHCTRQFCGINLPHPSVHEYTPPLGRAQGSAGGRLGRQLTALVNGSSHPDQHAQGTAPEDQHARTAHAHPVRFQP